MKFRSFLASVLVSAALLGSTQALGQKPSNVSLAWNKTWDVLPLIIAENNGYWRSRGLEVSYSEISGSPQGVQLMHSGQVDAAVISPVTLITGSEKGFNISGVAAMNGKSDPPQNTYLAGANIQSIKDLKGKKIGISNYGGDFEITLAALLRANGLDIKKDVITLIVPINAVAMAIVNGQIDAGASIPTFTTIALKQYPGKVHALAGTNDIPQIQKLENFQTLILSMSKKFIAEKRPIAVRFTQGYLDALRFIKANPRKSLEIWAEFSGNKIIAEWKAPPNYPVDGHITQGGVVFQVNHMLELGYIKERVKPEAIIDRSLLIEAAGS